MNALAMHTKTMRIPFAAHLSATALSIAATACSSDSNSSTSNGADAASAGGASAGSGGSSGSSTSSGGSSGVATGGTTASGGATSGGAAGTGGVATSGSSSAKALAAKLGRDHFLIGMGNDLADDHNQDGAYTLGPTLDLHYAYLVGLMGRGGWPDWNADGSFVNMLTDTAKAHGVVPMFTLYSMAASGEANSGVLTDDSYMGPYWDGAKLLFQRIAIFDDVAVVQFEPDWWAFAQLASADPSQLAVHVTSLAPDCAALPDTIVGMGKCLVLLARMYAPKAVVGFHASRWADGDVTNIANYMLQIGAGDADFLTTDMLDRDAGCFEAHVDPNCQRNDGPWYWDETNQTSPNFHEHLDWVKQLTDTVGKPLLWWQVPFGVPSDTPGGTAGHYRDNRVHYLFAHIDEFIAAGGVGAAFGVGAGNQTYIDTDGDQFKNAVTAYFQSPTPL